MEQRALSGLTDLGLVTAAHHLDTLAQAKRRRSNGVIRTSWARYWTMSCARGMTNALHSIYSSRTFPPSNGSISSIMPRNRVWIRA